MALSAFLNKISHFQLVVPAETGVQGVSPCLLNIRTFLSQLYQQRRGYWGVPLFGEYLHIFSWLYQHRRGYEFSYLARQGEARRGMT